MNITKKKSLLLVICKLVLAGIVALGLLDLFVLAFSVSGVHITNKTYATDYVWEPFQIKKTFDEGFASLRMDENGFNNLSVPESIDYLVMGSSQVEAVNINADENFVALLDSMFPGISFYNIGISGHTIYNCVNNLSYALDTFSPDKAIILVTDSIDLEEDSMTAVLNGSWKRIPSYDNGLLFHVQKKLPIVKTIYKKLEDWRNSESKVNTKAISQSNDYENRLQQFLSFAREKAGNAELIIVYQPVTYIDNNGVFVEEDSRETLGIFENACAINDIDFVDMTESFKTLYQNEHILAHGFSNTEVGVGHLNKFGHIAIANKVSELIKGESQ